MHESRPFELLASADVLVDDHDAVLQRWQDDLGLPAPNSRWTVDSEAAGSRWTYARLARNRHAAPTELEVIAPRRVPVGARQQGYAFIAEIAEAQGDRIAQLHSTVVATLDFDAVVERHRRAGAPHRINGPDAALPFPRLWLGFRAGDADGYDPSADEGLRLEVIPFAVLGYPDRSEAPKPEPDRPAGAVRRITGRLLLVDDLDSVLARLERNLGWAPDGGGAGRGRIPTGPDGLRPPGQRRPRAGRGAGRREQHGWSLRPPVGRGRVRHLARRCRSRSDRR
jgi:hypothetical protein